MESSSPSPAVTVRARFMRIFRSLGGFARRHPVWSAVIAVAAVLFLWILWFIFSPAAPQMVTAAVVRGDLVQKVEAVGTISSDHDVNLKFPVTGIVEDVLAQEGDRVSAGQELARLRNDASAADLAAASAQYQQARANLQELEEGTRPEDIAIAEADVANKKAALTAAQADFASAQEKLKTAQEKLEAIREEASTNLIGTLATSASTNEQQISLTRTSLKVLDDIFINSFVTDMAKQYRTTAWDIFQAHWESAQTALDGYPTGLDFTTYENSRAALQRAVVVITQAANVLQEAYALIADLPITTSYDTTTRESYKATIATEKADAQGALSAINTALKSLQDAAAGYDADIATEQNNLAATQASARTAQSAITTYETALRSQEAQLDLKKAGARPTQISAARASVNSAAASVARARANLENTVIRAPSDGTVTKVDFKEGEFTGDPDNIAHSITMLGLSPFRVEMMLSEVDIPKVALTQSGSVELDAFPGTHYALRVSAIDTGPTKVEGVSKYQVNLAFVHPHDEFKIGMTGDAEIVTGERKDVLLVPVRAVLQNNGQGKIVRVLENGKVVEKPVTTGMESDTDVEIESGLQEGETVIVLLKK